MQASTTLLSILAALGLAAACGFRVFVPLFLVSLASRAGHLTLSEGFAWIGSTPALVCFGTATVVEIVAYYVPVVDNFLDGVATPAAVVAGTVVAAAVLSDLDPWLKWTLATVAGGGLAAAVQLPTVALRGVSTGTTAGLGNALVSSGEALAAGTFSGLAIFLPVLLPLLAMVLVVVAWRCLRRGEPASA